MLFLGEPELWNDGRRPPPDLDRASGLSRPSERLLLPSTSQRRDDLLFECHLVGALNEADEEELALLIGHLTAEQQRLLLGGQDHGDVGHRRVVVCDHDRAEHRTLSGLELELVTQVEALAIGDLEREVGARWPRELQAPPVRAGRWDRDEAVGARLQAGEDAGRVELSRQLPQRLFVADPGQAERDPWQRPPLHVAVGVLDELSTDLDLRQGRLVLDVEFGRVSGGHEDEAALLAVSGYVGAPVGGEGGSRSDLDEARLIDVDELVHPVVARRQRDAVDESTPAARLDSEAHRIRVIGDRDLAGDPADLGCRTDVGDDHSAVPDVDVVRQVLDAAVKEGWILEEHAVVGRRIVVARWCLDGDAVVGRAREVLEPNNALGVRALLA